MYVRKEKIFIVLDRLTMAVKKTYSRKQIGEVLCKNIYKLHGLTKVIVRARDVKFKGKFWKPCCN